MTREPVELALSAHPGGPQPMAAQLAGQLREAMTDGRLAAGERLPATRALAATLGVSRTVVTSAYAQLFAEGWLEGRHGSGTFVAGGAPPASALTGLAGWPGGNGTGHIGGPGGTGTAVPRPGAGAGGTGPAPVNLCPGVPWAAGIDRAAWRRAWRQAAQQPPAAEPTAAGLPALRQALTSHLRRSRGVHCPASQIVITRGVAASLGLLAGALLQPGDLVGVEEPGYPVARQVFAARGARVVPCRADHDGLVTSELPAGLRMVYTTPAHQYPLGGRLPVPRRQALVAWARKTGALIVEDDYDGEFRYDVAPLPALFGLAPEVVVYLGTATKILTPGLATGWLAARPELATRIAEFAAAGGDRPSEQAQHALHALIASGDLERHIRRMRHEYARRRAAVVSLLADAAPGRLLGDTAGMHIVLELPPARAREIAAEAMAHGVATVTLDRHFAAGPDRGGLVLGYGGACLADVARGCHILAGLLGTPGSHGPDC